MTDEIKVTTEECKCFCKSEGFRKFLVVALGTFVGAFCALSLFAALHKPPMMMAPHPGMMMNYAGFAKPCRCHHGHFNKHFQGGEFQKQLPRDLAKKSPFEQKRVEN